MIIRKLGYAAIAAALFAAPIAHANKDNEPTAAGKSTASESFADRKPFPTSFGGPIAWISRRSG